MSIYSSMFEFALPKLVKGEERLIRVRAISVPPHIGCPEYGSDLYGEFLPPPVSENSPYARAVVFVVAGTPKGIGKHGQEYADTLLVITGEEYDKAKFSGLLGRIMTALSEREFI